ncbi:MAG: DUF4340 domain-containing protein [Bacteroidota bacterium]
MFRRFNNRQLSILLGLLALLYVGSWAFDRKGNASFTKELVLVDTSKVDQIRIALPEGKEDLELKKEGPTWKVGTPGGTSFTAANSQVNTALSALQGLTATQLVSTRESGWSEYGVNDSAGVRVELLGGGETLSNILLGRFQYQQTGMTTYARPEGDNNTYLVEGYVRSNFEKEVNEWRDKTLIKGPNSNWSALNFTYPGDSSFQMLRGLNNTWLLPDSTELDVTKVNRYLNRISSMKGSTFIDQTSGTPSLYTLQIQTASVPIEVKAYVVNDSTLSLGSSLNPEAYFEAKDLWKDIFVGLPSFLKSE